jgi:hypothetical protein
MHAGYDVSVHAIHQAVQRYLVTGLEPRARSQLYAKCKPSKLASIPDRHDAKRPKHILTPDYDICTGNERPLVRDILMLTSCSAVLPSPRPARQVSSQLCSPTGYRSSVSADRRSKQNIRPHKYRAPGHRTVSYQPWYDDCVAASQCASQRVDQRSTAAVLACGCVCTRTRDCLLRPGVQDAALIACSSVGQLAWSGRYSRFDTVD